VLLNWSIGFQRGTKPSDIPVEQPTKFKPVPNATTARAIGETIGDDLAGDAEGPAAGHFPYGMGLPASKV
jgi:hypothetical protein